MRVGKITVLELVVRKCFGFQVAKYEVIEVSVGFR